jgi:hypothetical protein
VVLGLGAFACLATSAAADSTILATRYPELQQLLLAHDVLQARAYEEIVITNDSPTAAVGQRMLLDKKKRRPRTITPRAIICHCSGRTARSRAA